MNRIAHDIDEAADVLRHAETHWHVKHFFRELHRTVHLRAAASGITLDEE